MKKLYLMLILSSLTVFACGNGTVSVSKIMKISTIDDLVEAAKENANNYINAIKTISYKGKIVIGVSLDDDDPISVMELNYTRDKDTYCIDTVTIVPKINKSTHIVFIRESDGKYYMERDGIRKEADGSFERSFMDYAQYKWYETLTDAESATLKGEIMHNDRPCYEILAVHNGLERIIFIDKKTLCIVRDGNGIYDKLEDIYNGWMLSLGSNDIDNNSYHRLITDLMVNE